MGYIRFDKRRSTAGYKVAAVAAACGLLTWAAFRGGEEVAGPTPEVQRAATRVAALPVAAPPPPAASPAVVVAPPAQRQLTAYERYVPLGRCARLRWAGRPEGGACEGMSPGEISSRMQYLEAAAEAGEPGAVQDYMREVWNGPWEPDDLTEGKVQHYLEVAASKGDPYALKTLSGGAYATKKYEEAIKLAVAAAEAGASDVDAERSVAYINKKAGLPPDRVNKAIAEGKELAASFKGSKQ